MNLPRLFDHVVSLRCYRPLDWSSSFNFGVFNFGVSTFENQTSHISSALTSPYCLPAEEEALETLWNKIGLRHDNLKCAH